MPLSAPRASGRLTWLRSGLCSVEVMSSTTPLGRKSRSPQWKILALHAAAPAENGFAPRGPSQACQDSSTGTLEAAPIRWAA
ncbi:hypothetical protein BP6252_05831 [Coleophoma cylindrospora]|uniref:Uncharacterized protein n=1 Tax=Coleophoma cylindrospora TaxID=1849047 RepID=A0A3D8RUX2_9HELO|nr:hypothetical protein BP6252_05831 [Coleophoma cylindrospora]